MIFIIAVKWKVKLNIDHQQHFATKAPIKKLCELFFQFIYTKEAIYSNVILGEGVCLLFLFAGV